MWENLLAWRCECLTTLAAVVSCLAFRYVRHRPFFRLLLPGVLLGLAIEFMTEPEWTYAVKVYLWRDVSPFIVLGWGLLFTWLVTLSDALYLRWFHVRPSAEGSAFWKLRLTDLVVGLPLFVGNELLGLHVLKIWKYNACLRWDTLIPVLQYPVEALVVIVLFILATPAAVRYWDH